MIQNIPDGLLLGQDQPPLGRGGVNGRDQQHDIVWLKQIPHDLPFAFRLTRDGGNGFLQLADAVAPGGADVKLMFAGFRKGFQQVALVQGDQIGHFPFLKQLLQGFVPWLHAPRRVHHQHSRIGLAQHLPGAVHPHFAQLALVVHAGGIDDHDRPQRQKLHGLLHRIGGGALHLGDQREALPRNGVHHAGFARVAQAEKADMGTVGGYLSVERVHPYLSFVLADG